MKNKFKEDGHKASTREYYSALAYFPNFIKLIDLTNKPYEKLAKWLVEKELLLKDDNLSLPSIKELSQELNISSQTIPKYLKMMYEDVLDLNFKEPHLFQKEGETLCCLSFTFLDAYCSFNIGMNTLPRIGDYLNFYFIKAKLGASGYYVDKIYHDLYYSGHSIMICLSTNPPNSYMKLLKEKAYLHGSISFMDFISNSNTDKDEIEKHLLNKYNSL